MIWYKGTIIVFISARILYYKNRADSRLTPSQWETSLQSNTVSHWLGTNIESALKKLWFLPQLSFRVDNGQGEISTIYNPPTRNNMCNGQWHRITAVKAKNVVTLYVDGVFAHPGIGAGGVSSTDTNDPLYIGGVPGKKLLFIFIFHFHCRRHFYSRPVLSSGYCCYLHLSVCVSAHHQVVRAITQHPFQSRKRPCLRSLLFYGAIDLELQGQR